MRELYSLTEEMPIRRFLLGIANKADADRVEEAIFAGDLDASILLNSEDELIDEYSAGILSAEERRAYTENFLVTEERKQRHSFNIALISYAKKQSTGGMLQAERQAKPHQFIPSLAWKKVTAFASAACLLFAALTLYENLQLHQEEQLAVDSSNELAQLRVTLARDANKIPEESPQAYILGELARADQMPVIYFSAPTRGILPISVRLSADVRFLSMKVSLPKPLSTKYRAVIVDADSGMQVWMRDLMVPEACASGSCATVVPASVLTGHTYHFKLEAAGPNGVYAELFDRVFVLKK